MNKDDWYRNKTWDADIEQNFNFKLKRARLKQDYLRVQASCLARTQPEVSLALLDRYFKHGIHFDMAQAWCDRAEAHLTLGQTEQALQAYSEALNEEDINPQHLTQAYLKLPMLVGDAGLEAWYSKAIETLEGNIERRKFYRDYYEWNAAFALILSGQGRVKDAKPYAYEAIQAALQKTAGIKDHMNIGIVRKDAWHQEIYKKIYDLAEYDKPSLKRSVNRLLRR
jgi:tetratricopeptide (TPR) repeat protein